MAASPTSAGAVPHGTSASSSPLLSALKAKHPLQAFQPAVLPPPADAEALHTRIAACLSSSHPITAKEGPKAIARLARLAAEAKSVLDAVDELKLKAQGANHDGDRSASAASLIEAAVTRFVKQHSKAPPESRYSVLRPPPTVTDGEVDRAVAALTEEERKALEGEFELTCLGFEWMSDPDEPFAGPSTAVTAAAASSPLPREGAKASLSSLLPSIGKTVVLSLMSPKGSSSPLPPQSQHHREVQGDPSPAATAVGEGDVPGFTLEAMPTPDALEDNGKDSDGYARFEDADGEEKDGGGHKRNQRWPRAVFDSAGACTVEVEYTMDRWAQDAQSSPSLATEGNRCSDEKDGGFTVPPFALPAGSAPTHQSDEEEGGEEPPQSFGQFSRLVLQHHQEEINDRAKKAEEAKAPQQSSPPSPRESAEKEAETAPPPPAAVVEADEDRRQPKRMERRRAAFVRQRVRDVLLANKVESRERDRLTLGTLADVHKDVLDAAQTALPAMERLTVLAKESEVLLSALDGLERSALSARLDDPAQFLLVPRLRTTCYNVTCNKMFSALVPRETCRRCGQTFCPQCCKDCGLGPPVVCNGESVSLGWEPLCHTCFALCEESQSKIAAERKRRRLLSSADASAPYHDPPTPNVVYEPDSEGDDGIGDRPGEPRKEADATEGGKDPEAKATHPADLGQIPFAVPTIESLSVKEAVLFGAYCGETRQLHDGLPPFYVATNADDTAAFWDVLLYRFAKLRGTVLAQYQTAGQVAKKVIAGAATLAVTNVHSAMPKRLAAGNQTAGEADEPKNPKG